MSRGRDVFYSLRLKKLLADSSEQDKETFWFLFLTMIYALVAVIVAGTVIHWWMR